MARLKFGLDVVYDLKNNKQRLVMKSDILSRLSPLKIVCFFLLLFI